MANQYAFQTIVVPGAQSTQLTGINDGAGTPAELSGIYTMAPPNFPYQQAFIMEGGATITFGPNGQPYGLQNTAGGLNSFGKVAGFSGHFVQTERGYLYTPGSGGSFTPMLSPTNTATTMTTASGVNDWGEVVGKVALNDGAGGWAGYIMNGSSMMHLRYMGAAITSATGINDKGEVVGFYNSSPMNGDMGDRGFVYEWGNFQKIDVAGAQATIPTAVNNRGEIVGSYFDGTAWHGFIDDGGKMSFVDAPGATDTHLTGVNDFGQVSGYAAAAHGAAAPDYGFVATPGNGSNLPTLAESAPLPLVVQKLTGDTIGHAYFDPSLPLTVVQVAHA